MMIVMMIMMMVMSGTAPAEPAPLKSLWPEYVVKTNLSRYVAGLFHNVVDVQVSTRPQECFSCWIGVFDEF